MTQALARSVTDDDLMPGYEKPNALAKRLIASFQPETRKALLGVWGMHRHLPGAESPLPISQMVHTWIRDWGLAEADAAACLRTLTDPEAMGRHKFGSDLYTALAKLVTQAIKERKRKLDMASRSGPEIAPEEQQKAAGLIRNLVENWQ